MATIEEIRERMMAMGAGMKFDNDMLYPADIESIDNVLVGPDPVFNAMDIYRPAGTQGQKLPVIVSIHGGGWVVGDKAGYRAYCCTLAREGFTVLSVNYHLAPEAKFPAPLEDVNMAFAWMMDHADEYSFDTEHVFAVGDSAGGHLLGLYTDFVTNGQYAGQFKFRAPEGLKLTALAFNCAQYDIRPEDRSPEIETYEIMAGYLPNGGTDEELKNICVTNFITKHFPPSFLMSGVADFLYPQAAVMQNALAKKNVPFEFHFYSMGSKKLGHVFHLNVNLEVSRACNHDECEYFKRFL